MTIVVDAGALYAQADRREPAHRRVIETLKKEPGPFITSQIAIAEADYLILTRLGVAVELAFLRDLAEGTFAAECLTSDELVEADRLARRHKDRKPGLADLSLILLARRFRTRRLLTLDERGFRRMTPLQGGAFTILPADE